MKKVIALLLAAAMVMSLAACGNSAAPAAETKAPAEATEAAAPAAEAGSPEAAAAEEALPAGAGLVGKDINDPSVTVKIAFVTMSTQGITNVLYDAAKRDAMAQYPNVDIQTFDCQYDVTTQNRQIEECITNGFDAIITEPMDTEALNASITAAEEAGIAVISLNLGASATHSIHLQGNDYGMGYYAGQYLGEALNDKKGKIIVIDFPTAMMASARQSTGFYDALAEYGPACEVIDYQNLADVTTATAMTTIQQMLTKANNEVDAVYAVTDDVALGAVQAIEAAGIPAGQILVWGGTGYNYAFEGIRDGSWYGTTWCDTYNQVMLCIQMAMYFTCSGVNSYKAGYTTTPIVYQQMIPVTKDNVDQIQPLSRWDIEG